MSLTDVASHMRNVSWALSKDKPLSVAKARRAVTAIIDYLRFDDESPVAGDELETAVAFLLSESYNRGRADGVGERLTK